MSTASKPGPRAATDDFMCEHQGGDAVTETPEKPAAAFTPRADSLNPQLPRRRPPMPKSIGITHLSRFTVPAVPEAPQQARVVARGLLTLFLGSGEVAERTARRVLLCLAEYVAVAYSRSRGDLLLCELWRDDEDVFVSVEHDEPLPATPGDSTLGLVLVKSLASDYGSHVLPGSYQMWAAVRIG